ncbi:hypothetical protein B7P43_G14501 [Cryptotermes secundus]|uniref:Uncharacterized protein n=1 Tax=Cryptotermes secundus TaxID=105785 RepID=A0A2J7PPP9_9NEOP|nr:hypothetical protein B7P43_G14501 [Cryptotermes secundus]
MESVAMNIDKKQDDFRPRPYQEQLMNIAKVQNTIIYLPTGSGKTFIAVMLIKEMSSSLDKGKHTFFVVNTVALVSQQAAYIRRHSHHSVGEYSGDLNVDLWSKEKWQEELLGHQIMVMTCQIFLNLLLHGYIKLSDINLLIFDECHHAVNDQPMRQVMQQFEHCPPELQPRILGLTATLLNSNCKPERVDEEVRSLETTFLSKVATCENMPLVDRYSTNPTEKVVKYSIDKKTPGLSVLEKGLKLLKNIQEFVQSIQFECDQVVPPHERPPNTVLMDTSQGKMNKKLKNLLTDVIFHIEMLGMFGGSQACLAHIIQFERLRKKAQESLTKNVFMALITTLVAVRKLFEDEMSDCVVKSQIHKYSSYKVLTLLEVLRSAMPKETVNDDSGGSVNELSDDYVSRILAHEKKKMKPCAIVFVERRFTAKVLCLLLKALKEADSDFDYINPDFIVGFNNNPFNDTREGALEKKWNRDCMRRFLRGQTNVLVASDVLEEGIDIQKCNLVVKFDVPRNYRSYIQSKGRARHRSSQYIMMVPCITTGVPFNTKYNIYRATENAMQTLLIGRTEGCQEPDNLEIATEQYDHLAPPFLTSCSKVTLASAIPLINWYCSMLPQDKFTQLAPLWYLGKGKEKCTRIVFLQLPMNSPLRELVQGNAMPTKKLAKRSVALETCIKLYKMGELNEHLLPRDRQETLLTCPELFPLFREVEMEDGPRPGTKKSKQVYRKEYPAALSECRPREGIVLYLHTIEQRPVYPRPDATNNRKLVFYNLLHQSEGFAVLSAKMMPKLCDFPIFMNVGELRVHIENNAVCLHLTHEDIQDLEAFNAMLFRELLKLMRTFMVVDKDNKENSYFVVPTRLGEDRCPEIMWDVVRQGSNLLNIQRPSREECRTLEVTAMLFENNVVAPWYRSVPHQNYIVTQVCSDLTSSSPFPSEDYTSYEHYYSQKYELDIINKDQPLLEVKAIPNHLNCLRPKGTKVSSGASRRKRHELQEDFEENLVAELCVRFEFPSVLWLKATCLPSILHRITYLLLAEELRQNIMRDIGVGCVELPPDMEWKPLSVDQCCTKEEQRSSSPPKITGMESLQRAEPANPVTSTLFDWGDDKEPVDIDRNMADVTLVEVLNYDEFISKPLSNRLAVHGLHSNDVSPAVSCDDEAESDVQIAILNTSINGIGPQQCDILQALTSSSANDILNLERLETLGDSFLKLMSSLYLFRRYGLVNEGKLTCIKGKMVGNRNLYYIGDARKLGGLMKVHDFGSASDWIPPGMCVYRKLQQVMRDASVSPNILYELHIPTEEQLSGQLSRATLTNIEQKMLSTDDDRGIHSSMENFLSLQTVSDKTIADGVEALIGAYLKGSGIRGALKLLVWLQVLPATIAAPEYLLDTPPPSARLTDGEIELHLEGVSELERRLDYKFRDRSFLLQAVTHASYSANRVTDCYQRLEFLGDAVLGTAKISYLV